MINSKKGRYLSLPLVLIGGVLVSFFTSYFVYKAEDAKVRTIFYDASAYRFKYLEDSIQNNISVLESFGDFYAASREIDRDEFDKFAQGIFLRQPYIFEFRYLPKVLRNERAGFEESARKSGLVGFQIFDLNKEEQPVRAAEREVYLPIYCLSSAPWHQGRQVKLLIGFDAADFPERWQAMQKARDTGQPTLASEIRHVWEADVHTASRIFLPVYRNNLPHNTPGERQDNLMGFVVLLYQIDKLVTESLRGLPKVGVDITISEATSGGKKLIYFRPARIRKQPITYEQLENKSDIIWSASLKAADRDWLVSCTPSPEFLNSHKIILPWITLFIGFILALLFSLYLKNIISRANEIELLVKQRTEELLRSEEKCRVLYESSQDAIMTIEPPGWSFTGGNLAAIKLFGASDEKDFISRSPEELSPEFQPDGEQSLLKAKRMIELAMKNGSNYFEWTHRRLDGQVFPATVLLSKVEIGSKIYLQATVRDITAAKETEERIKRANQEWADTFNSISDFVFIIDGESRITNANKAFLGSMHLEKEDVVGKRCYEIVHKASSPWPNCPHQKTISDHKAHTEKVEDPGLGLPLLITTSPIFNESGEFTGSIHIAKDISDIVRAEEALKKAKDELEVEAWGLAKANEGIKVLYKELEVRNAELRKIDQLKSEFVSVVSHELRTPLAIMKEGVSLVLDNITGKINDKTRDTLGMVFSNIDRLSKLISDLLDISKIEAGKVQIRKGLVDINHLVSDTVEKWKFETDKKKQELSISVGKGRLNVYLDADKIIQVLNNLISNAIKFTPDKGWIKVEVEDKKDEVEVSVSDSGAGISGEDIPRVFEKFQQFNRPIGSGSKGTGLGLAISKELVNMHEGVIKVESKPTQGSKFSFTLPKKDSETVFKEHINSGIREVAERKANMCLISMRISEFPRIQKELGQEKTHDFLREIERIINESLRRKADTVVRDTGELIVILFDTVKPGAEVVRQRIEEVIKNYLSGLKEELLKSLSFSIGIASYPNEAKTEMEMLNKARGIIRA